MKNRRIAFTSMALILLSCGSAEPIPGAMEFCPSDIENDARKVLNLGAASEVRLDELLLDLEARGLKYEEARADAVPRKCENVTMPQNFRSYKVYGGVDESKKFARIFLIVADSSGTVQYVEARHQYRAP